jgi:hypothetical protein
MSKERIKCVQESDDRWMSIAIVDEPWPKSVSNVEPRSPSATVRRSVRVLFVVFDQQLAAIVFATHTQTAVTSELARSTESAN